MPSSSRYLEPQEWLASLKEQEVLEDLVEEEIGAEDSLE